MNPHTEQQEDLVDLGLVNEETKGPPVGIYEDFGLPLRPAPAGLSND